MLIPTRQLSYIYDNTTAGSPLRRLLVEMSAYNGNMDDDVWIDADDPEESIPHAFLLDLAICQCKIRKGTTPPIREVETVPSNYYV